MHQSLQKQHLEIPPFPVNTHNSISWQSNLDGHDSKLITFAVLANKNDLPLLFQLGLNHDTGLDSDLTGTFPDPCMQFPQGYSLILVTVKQLWHILGRADDRQVRQYPGTGGDQFVQHQTAPRGCLQWVIDLSISAGHGGTMSRVPKNSLLIIFPRSAFRSPACKRKEGHI